jgi:hypothetical protein
MVCNLWLCAAAAAVQLSKMVKRPFVSWVTQRVWNFDNDPTCYIMYYPQLLGCRCGHGRRHSVLQSPRTGCAALGHPRALQQLLDLTPALVQTAHQPVAVAAVTGSRSWGTGSREL